MFMPSSFTFNKQVLLDIQQTSFVGVADFFNPPTINSLRFGTSFIIFWYFGTQYFHSGENCENMNMAVDK